MPPPGAPAPYLQVTAFPASTWNIHSSVHEVFQQALRSYPGALENFARRAEFQLDRSFSSSSGWAASCTQQYGRMRHRGAASPSFRDFELNSSPESRGWARRPSARQNGLAWLFSACQRNDTGLAAVRWLMPAIPSWHPLPDPVPLRVGRSKPTSGWRWASTPLQLKPKCCAGLLQLFRCDIQHSSAPLFWFRKASLRRAFCYVMFSLGVAFGVVLAQVHFFHSGRCHRAGVVAARS